MVDSVLPTLSANLPFRENAIISQPLLCGAKVMRNPVRWVDRVFGTHIRAEVRQAIEHSEEWQRYRDESLEVAEAHTPG